MQPQLLDSKIQIQNSLPLPQIKRAMKKSIYLFIIVSIIISFSCKKEASTFNIQGKVVNKQTQENLGGVTIYLDAKKIENGVYNSSFVNIESTVSNGDGSFLIEHEEATISEYRFRISESGYFPIEELVPTDVIQSNDGYNNTFELIQKSWIELDVKNTMPQGTDDKITYRFSNVEVKGKDCCNNITITGIGYDYEAHHKCSVRSLAWIKIQWTVTKSGNQSLHNDSVYTEVGNTVNYTINY